MYAVQFQNGRWLCNTAGETSADKSKALTFARYVDVFWIARHMRGRVVEVA